MKRMSFLYRSIIALVLGLLTTSDASALTVRGTPVTVMNTAPDGGSIPMINFENPDRSPYQEFGSGSINPPFANGFISFPTPMGKRYILEYLSVRCNTPSNTDTFNNVFFYVTKALNSQSTTSFPGWFGQLVKVGSSAFGGYDWVGTVNIHLYSDPDIFTPGGGSGITLSIFHTDVAVTATCTATVSGHTVSNP